MNSNMSAICLGAAQYGSQVSEKEGWRLLDRYHELGGNFIDTAHVYGAWDKSGVNGGAGNSELVIGRWLRSNNHRDQVYVGTKGGHPDFDTNASRLTQPDLMRELNESLDRLQTDYVDLYWLHRDEQSLPVSEILGWLEGPLRDGRIKAIGVSNWRLDRLAEAQSIHGPLEKPILSASQIAGSLAVSNWSRREGPFGEEIAFDDEAYTFHQSTQLPLVAYSAQAGGVFASKYDAVSIISRDFPRRALKDRYGNAYTVGRRNVARQLANAKGCSTNQIALAYLLDMPFPVYPIIGPGSIAQLADSMGAVDVSLSPAEYAALHEAI